MDAVLEMCGVRKTYGSGSAAVEVLRGIDLRVEHGEFVAIVGPSGSGKSTLLNLVGCLDRPSAGTLRVQGQEVARLDDRALSRLRRSRIGFVFQSFHLIPHLSVLENVEVPLLYARLPRRERRRRANAMIDRVGLTHRAHHRPNALSGGECQRAAVARALGNDPGLLLADEPTGNLDSSNSAAMMKLFDELHSAGSTIVMITHDGGLAARVPRRVVLLDGTVEVDIGGSGGDGR